MLIRRLIVKALFAAARNPQVQRKAGEAAGKAVDRARPGLMKASRRAGELTRKAGDKIGDKIKGLSDPHSSVRPGQLNLPAPAVQGS